MQRQPYQGPERRLSQVAFEGMDRRKPDPIFEETTWTPDNPGTGRPRGKQEEESRAQPRTYDDTH